VTGPILYKYLDLGPRAFSTMMLPSGEKVFVSLVPKGLAVHRLHLGGWIPGRRLFAASTQERDRMVRVLRREEDQLPPLPTAVKEHRDDGALMEFMDAAILDLNAVSAGKVQPRATDKIDTDNPPTRAMSLFTRLALSQPDAAALSARFDRVRNIPG